MVMSIFTKLSTINVLAQNCEPGICAKIPGTVYNEELDQCSWADEIPGCSVQGILLCQ